MNVLRNLFSGAATKALFAALAAAGTAYVAASSDGVLTSAEVAEILGAFIAALGFVYRIPFAGASKAIAATAVSALGAAVVAIDNGGGIDGNEVYAIVAIIFAAVGTYVFPNATSSQPTT